MESIRWFVDPLDLAIQQSFGPEESSRWQEWADPAAAKLGH